MLPSRFYSMTLNVGDPPRKLAQAVTVPMRVQVAVNRTFRFDNDPNSLGPTGTSQKGNYTIPNPVLPFDIVEVFTLAPMEALYAVADSGGPISVTSSEIVATLSHPIPGTKTSAFSGIVRVASRTPVKIARANDNFPARVLVRNLSGAGANLFVSADTGDFTFGEGGIMQQAYRIRGSATVGAAVGVFVLAPGQSLYAVAQGSDVNASVIQNDGIAGPELVVVT